MSENYLMLTWSELILGTPLIFGLWYGIHQLIPSIATSTAVVIAGIIGFLILDFLGLNGR